MSNEWANPEHAAAYLARMKQIPHRAEGEATLLSEIPTTAKRVLDLGCGNGHLLALVLEHCPDCSGIGLDFSSLMLQQARDRFAEAGRVELVNHNLDNPLPGLGAFDCVVSSFAIHHCDHERKRAAVCRGVVTSRVARNLLQPGTCIVAESTSSCALHAGDGNDDRRR